MRPTLLVPLALAGLLGVTGCYIDEFGGFGRFTRDFHYSYALKPDGRLSIEGFNGSIDVAGWDQNMVDITGTKYAPSQDAAEALKIEIDTTPDSLSVRAVRPAELHGNRGARFSVKMPRRAVLDLLRTSNGQIHVTDGAGPARFRTSNGSVRVEGFSGRLDAQTSNGAVELTDVTGEVTVRTSNGHIHTDNLKGSLEAHTSNGTITAGLADAGDRPLRLESSNGAVDLTLPSKFNNDVRVSTTNGHITLHLQPGLNARVLARTNNASVTSDFEVRQSEIRRNRMDGVIGYGGPLLDLTTSNAGIRLARM
ncbi:MAG TPA: DUF4097 family beta strand repeat-containing protein [Bryobacteraceae bacterium]|nr:DUF4097 family beta strand repeat-containing protein [Bryobacteraceae bacterium]